MRDHGKTDLQSIRPVLPVIEDFSLYDETDIKNDAHRRRRYHHAKDLSDIPAVVKQQHERYGKTYLADNGYDRDQDVFLIPILIPAFLHHVLNGRGNTKICKKAYRQRDFVFDPSRQGLPEYERENEQDKTERT